MLMLSSQAARTALLTGVLSSGATAFTVLGASRACSDTPCLVPYILLGFPLLALSTLGVLVFGLFWDANPREVRWMTRGLYTACLFLQLVLLLVTW